MVEGPIRVLIVAEDPLVRSGLRQILEQADSLQIVGQVPAELDMISILGTLQPDALLWDLGWQSGEALDILAQIGEDLPVVVLADDGSEATEAFAAGARAVLQRDVSADKLAVALQAVLMGLKLTDLPISEPAATYDHHERSLVQEQLTPRELEVLRLLAEGITNKAIAFRLQISEYTVKFHVNTILRKLGAQSRTEAVARAARLGLITL